MAQYDGAIRIATKITTKDATESLASLEYQIKKSAKYMDELRSKMDTLKDQKISTEKYKTLQHAIASSKQSMEALLEEQKKLSDRGIGKGADEDYFAAAEAIRRLKTELQQAINLGDKDAYLGIEDRLNRTKSILQEMMSKNPRPLGDITYYYSIDKKIGDLKNNISETELKMKELEKSGKGFTLGQDTAEYQSYAKQLRYEEEAVAKAAEHYKTLLKTSGEYKQLGNVSTDELKKIGKNIKKHVISAFQSLHKVTKNIFSGIGKVAKSVFSNIGKSTKKSEGLISTLGSRFKGLALSLLIFNQVSKAFNAMISGMKEGFSNLYNDKGITSFKKSVDSLKASILTLKNSFAAAFRPIVEIAIPYIQNLIDYMVQLMNVVSQFMAAITGQKNYTKAIKQTTAAIEDQNKAQKKQLSNLDNLNNLTSDAAGGAGAGAGDMMFEEVPIDSKFNWIREWADELKSLWNNKEWFDIGSHIAEMLNAGLKKLNNWINKKFRPWATKWASRIAKILNGAVAKLNWGLLGETVASGVNAVFAAVDRFLIEFDFLKLGEGVGTAIKSWFDSIEWDLIGDTFANKWNALIHFIQGIVTTEGIWKSIGDSLGLFIRFWFTGIDYDGIATIFIESINGIFEMVKAFIDQDPLKGVVGSITSAINRVFKEINWEENGRTLGEFFMYLLNNLVTFIKDVEWENLGRSVGEFLKNAFDTINFEEIGEAIGEVIQAGIDFLAGLSEYFTVSDLLDAIIKCLEGAMSVDGFANLATLLLSLLALKIQLSVTASIMKVAADAILKSLATSIAESGVLTEVATEIINGIGGAFSGLSGIGSAIGGFLTADIGTLLASGSLATIGGTIAAGLIGGIVAAWGGFRVGRLIYNAITGEDFELGLIDTIKEVIGSFADGTWIEAFKLMGIDCVNGFKKGIEELFTPKGILTFISTNMFGPFVNIFRDLFGIHSPSTVFEGFGKNIVEGLLNGLKETWKSVIEWITNKITWLSNKLSGIAGNVKSAFTGGGNSNAKTNSRSTLFSAPKASTPYAANPAFATLSTTPIPKLATGAVIPANKEFLAVLGDQKHGTNIEAPLGMIEEAVINAIAKVNAASQNNNGGGQEINLNLTVECEGYRLIQLFKKLDGEYFKQTGRHVMA